MDILEAYALGAPDKQHILDIFKGEWSSRLPDQFELDTQPGTARLFEDDRVTWAEKIFGGFRNWNILELGPLEGGHSYMFQDRHANEIIAIEANTRAFLKCLCIKEVLRLDKVKFMLGDFVAYLKKDTARYDMVVASGVLYHMENPLDLLKLIARVSDRAFFWTHYYDEEIIAGNDTIAGKFDPVCSLEYEGLVLEYATQAYKGALEWSGYCGGPQRESKWLTRESIMIALKHFGFVDLQINFDDPDHPNGPAFALCAKK